MKKNNSYSFTPRQRSNYGLLLLCWILCFFIPNNAFSNLYYSLSIEKNIELAPQIFTERTSIPSKTTLNRSYQYTIQTGDTLVKIFDTFNIPYRNALPIIHQIEQVFDTNKIQAGQKITLSFEKNTNRVKKFILEISSMEKVIVTKEQDNSYTPQIIAGKTITKFMRSQGTIQSSAYMAAKLSNLPEKLISEFIRIYSHSVDFQRGIKKGDTFEILYERKFTLSGKPTNKMSIIYASLKSNGQKKEVYRYSNGNAHKHSYYDRYGSSIKRQLLSTPINGARLSSGFGMRKHPILGYSKMHKGIDFAAPKGTPIFAAGDGIIVKARYDRGGYGRYVQIHHKNHYTTTYAHLYKFAKGIRSGTRVKQGQIIGYVGSTGRSTGNHLHYEVQRNGKHINPTNIAHASQTKLRGVELAKFYAYSNSVQELVSNIPVIRNTDIASLVPRTR